MSAGGRGAGAGGAVDLSTDPERTWGRKFVGGRRTASESSTTRMELRKLPPAQATAVLRSRRNGEPLRSSGALDEDAEG